MVCWWTVSHWWMLVPRLSPALATAEQLLARHQRSPAAVRVNTERGTRPSCSHYTGGNRGKYLPTADGGLTAKYTANLLMRVGSVFLSECLHGG